MVKVPPQTTQTKQTTKNGKKKTDHSPTMSNKISQTLIMVANINTIINKLKEHGNLTRSNIAQSALLETSLDKSQSLLTMLKMEYI